MTALSTSFLLALATTVSCLKSSEPKAETKTAEPMPTVQSSVSDDAGGVGWSSASPDVLDGATIQSIGAVGPAADGGVAPFGPGMTRPEAIGSSAPDFSAAVGEKHLSGRVLVRCAITTTGEAQNCAVIHGEPELAAPIIQWLKKTRFQPATLDGKPVPIWYLFTFNIRSQ